MRPAPAKSPVRPARPALVLRRFPFGESSLVVHLLTPEEGRVSLLAKGAYRPSSGFFAVFDLFDTLGVGWNARRGSELGLVARAEVRARRPALGLDLERYRAALALLELAGLTAREEHEERELFRWLESGLDLLQAGRVPPALVGVASDLSLLRSNGLAPALEQCASCGQRTLERAGSVPFSHALGGRLCSSCAASERARRRPPESLPLNLIRVAASLMEATPVMLVHIHVEALLLERVRSFVGRFLEYHLETRLRTRAAAFATHRR